MMSFEIVRIEVLMSYVTTYTRWMHLVWRYKTLG